MLKPLERRKTDSKKGSPLPKDYLKMVSEVFTTNFDEPLKKIIKATQDKTHFQIIGEVFPEEIVLCVSLIQEKSLSATSVYASVDFDPKASTPNIQDLLPLCVDAIGTVYQAHLLVKDVKDLVALVEGPLSALDNVPFEWTVISIEKKRIHVKMDKANPLLDKMADDWLNKHDPKLRELEQQEEDEMKDLFITGPKKPKSSGELH